MHLYKTVKSTVMIYLTELYFRDKYGWDKYQGRNLRIKD
jgi:hypothetical protein